MTAIALLSDEESTEFENLYKRLIQERFGNSVIPSAAQLTFCKELRLGAQMGDVPHGGEMHHVVPADIDYTDPATIAAIRRPSGLSLPQLALLVALALAFIVYVLMTVTGINKPTAKASGSAVVMATPTRSGSVAGIAGIAASTVPANMATPLPAPTVAAGFVTVAGEVLPTVRPNSLELEGRSFLVYVAPVKEGNWYVRQEPGIANWVPGSIVNWSFALFVGPDQSTQAWLAQLHPGSTATLRIADGRAVPFSITERREINRSQIEFLDPHRPGLTVVIKAAQGDSRLLLRGVSLADATPEPTVEP